MAKLNVEIVTPEKRLVQLEADEIIAPGALGLFGVRPGHTPLISVMAPGLLTVRDGATTQKYFVSGGFVEVGPEQVRVLADSAQTPESIDVAATRKKLEAAEEALATLTGPNDLAYEAAVTSVAREKARIAAAAQK
ncbi:MAG: ATP synthase F1 subunit epsilon [Myxococcaceae bacterium]|nr:ATP synthase F1 subunit epsilon [Myxococcaceae bacterium]